MAVCENLAYNYTPLTILIQIHKSTFTLVDEEKKKKDTHTHTRLNVQTNGRMGKKVKISWKTWMENGKWFILLHCRTKIHSHTRIYIYTCIRWFKRSLQGRLYEWSFVDDIFLLLCFFSLSIIIFFVCSK